MAQNTEIERKFLVRSDEWRREVVQQFDIQQGYLCKEADKTIRVRVRDERAFLTIKSDRLREGLAKFEWEREIDLSDAKELLQLCMQPILHKTRYIIPCTKERGTMYEGQRIWEVDVFHGHKEGLVLAELELGSEDEAFVKPEWLGEEVTGQPQYYNANM
ncbi:MAG: CYTH domain-containing protein [Paludibacteraceae bacterium]|nr:CYTH domain-containing protein [Paludibacteraceae bacterium]